MKHYPFGSSTAHRTNACQQWRAQSEGLPRSESKFAIDGTVVHGILEAWMLEQETPEGVEGHKVTDEHLELAEEMFAVAEGVLDRYGCVEVEPEVTGEWASDVGGTLDLVGLGAKGELVLLDYKSGAGKQVEAKGNDQLLFAAAMMIYGESSCADFVAGSTSFVGVIIQPARDGVIQTKVWEFDRETLDAWWDYHKEKIELARKGEGALVAGDHCAFCPAQAVCPATTGQLLRMQQLDPERRDDLIEALNLIEPVKATIRAVEKMAYEQLEVGVDLPGWKLVRGRKNRAWADEAEAKRRLKSALRGAKINGQAAVRSIMTEPKLVTPAQAEKVLKKAGREDKLDVNEIAPVPESTTMTLAPEDDPREACVSPTALEAALASIQ